MMIPKFRAWNIKEKRFDGLDLYISLGGKLYEHNCLHRSPIFEVSPLYIVTQSTGLFDKNGEEAYRDDILSETASLGVKHLFLVKWDEVYACFYLHCFTNQLVARTMSDIRGMEYEGNKFENPELLSNADVT